MPHCSTILILFTAVLKVQQMQRMRHAQTQGHQTATSTALGCVTGLLDVSAVVT